MYIWHNGPLTVTDTLHLFAMNLANDNSLIQRLLYPDCYEHPVEQVELLHTHISWVLLAGQYAYKIKKPVKFDFLDFSDLNKRKHFCEEELRLNQRFSPDIYLAVVPITSDNTTIRMNGKSTPLEYAVKMRRFSQEARLDNMLVHHQLSPHHIDNFAQRIASFHLIAPHASDNSLFAAADNVCKPIAENFEQIKQCIKEPTITDQIQALSLWAKHRHQQLYAVFEQRKALGFIRECHGDLHLANMALIHQQATLFDCIEFNESFRWIDVMSEIAFLCMDLDDHHCPSLAWRFLNNYLSLTGDYAGLQVFNYYLAYRAMVRAKVSCLQLTQTDLSDTEIKQTQKKFQGYILLAKQYTVPRDTPLIITHGLSGSGKSTLTQILLEKLGAIRIRSDIERKRLFDLHSRSHAEDHIKQNRYSEKSFQATYQHLTDMARLIISCGFPVIIDATFLKQSQRQRCQSLARQLQVPFIILDCQAPKHILQKRITHRLQQTNDASEADLHILDQQIITQEPLNENEKPWTLTLNHQDMVEPSNAVKKILSTITCS